MINTLLSLLFVVPAAYADGGCDTRPIRPNEARMYERVYAAIQAALPPVPKGWQVRSEDGFDVPETVCVGAEKAPLVVGWQRTVEIGDEERAARDQKALGKAKAVSAKSLAKASANSGKIADIDSRIDALTKQMEQLAAKGDFAKMEKVTVEIEKLSAQKAGAMGHEQVAADTRALENEQSEDSQLVLNISVNLASVPVGNEMERFELRGATHAFHWTAEYQGAFHTDAYAFLGNYSGVKREGGGVIKHFLEKGLPYTGVHSVAVQASGTKERAMATLKATSLGKLGALAYKDQGRE